MSKSFTIDQTIPSGVLSSYPRLVGYAGVRGGHLVQPGQHPGAHPQGHEEPRQHDPHWHCCRRLPCYDRIHPFYHPHVAFEVRGNRQDRNGKIIQMLVLRPKLSQYLCQMSFAWGIFMLFHINFTVMIHTVSIFLTLALATWRLIRSCFASSSSTVWSASSSSSSSSECSASSSSSGWSWSSCTAWQPKSVQCSAAESSYFLLLVTTS